MTRSTDLAALAEHWSSALSSWAIPDEILRAADRDPWALPVSRFAARADRMVDAPSGPSFERAVEVLRGDPGSVLDVGSGAGAASLPLAGPLAAHATSITAVDSKPEMLQAFSERAEELGVAHATVEGIWPDVASDMSPHDVVVVHHVVYNVSDIVPFVRALDQVGRRRVVLELPTHHPLTWMGPLWQQFHGITRPTQPIAGDLVEILSALELADVTAEYWTTRTEAGFPSDPAQRLEVADLVAQRLCLPSSRAQDVADALEHVDRDDRDLVTVSWTPTPR
ncbi:MAG TPA: class I SAM-dependent methyltransferase [Actinomycetes bacterium]|nr:class I SAM-dependent methyltransferase [Actinomycetes bacterium]